MSTKRLLGWPSVIVLLAVLTWLGIRLMPPSKSSERGVVEGKLAGCPSSPNCVSTESADVKHRINPLTFMGSLEDAREKLIRIVGQMPRTSLVTQSEKYLHFECRSRLFKFVDDLEFYIDAERKVIQIRSAARLGYSDLGVNRKRVAKIRQAFLRGGT